MTDKTKTMDLEAAWRKFYESRESRPSESDYQRVCEIMEVLGATEFKILLNYISDAGNTVHVNPGFLASKVEAPYSSWDDTYEEVGYTWRLKFSNFGASGGAPKETTTPPPPYCWSCESYGHKYGNCPSQRCAD